MNRHSERILIRGVNWLGDAVMTTPALLRLRQAKPQAHITLLTPAKIADLWLNHPALDACISLQNGDSPWKVASQLRKHRFDAAVLLPNSPRSGLEVWLAGIPVRIGYARPWRRWFLTQNVALPRFYTVMKKRTAGEVKKLLGSPEAIISQPLQGKVHHIHHYLHLMSVLGADEAPMAPSLEVKPGEVEAALKKWNLPSDGGLLLGMNPGAEYGAAKRWPAQRFIELAVAVSSQIKCHWVIFGGPKDVTLSGAITSEIQKALALSKLPDRSVSLLAGKTDLRQLCCLLKGCRAVITNDTGPMHVAAAVGTTVIALFGSSSPELTGPGMPGERQHVIIQNRVPCAPCFLRECPVDARCLSSITVEQVLKKTLKTLES